MLGMFPPFVKADSFDTSRMRTQPEDSLPTELAATRVNKPTNLALAFRDIPWLLPKKLAESHEPEISA